MSKEANDLPDLSKVTATLPDLANYVVSGAVGAIAKADMLIIAGTSLTVYPAAGLVRYFHGKHLVLINRDATPMDYECNLVIHDKVGEVLSSLT